MTQLNSPAPFFVAVRRAPFAAPLTTPQVQGLNMILKAGGAAGWPIAYMAYALATAYHETSATMQPIRERGGAAYLAKYDTGRLAANLGNTPAADGDGIKFAGRGYVQLTGATNYKRASRELGIDLIGNPDLALDAEIAAKIMVLGMSEGWFTGRGLDDYLPSKGTASAPMFTQARRIINGIDCAGKIAAHAVDFQTALLAGVWA